MRVGQALVRATDEKARLDDILVDGQPLQHPHGLLLLLHKPAGVVCSTDVREGTRVVDLLPPQWGRRLPPLTTVRPGVLFLPLCCCSFRLTIMSGFLAQVGRLDKDTTGALLVTDDGELVHAWTSPRHKVPKLYQVEVDRDLPPELPALFAAGTIVLDGTWHLSPKPAAGPKRTTAPQLCPTLPLSHPRAGQRCRPATAVVCGPRSATVTLVEGRYHQVKRMFSAAGVRVVRLHRASFGAHNVEGLAPGEWRMLDLAAARGGAASTSSIPAE